MGGDRGEILQVLIDSGELVADILSSLENQ